MVIAFKDNMGCIIAMYPISFISMESDDKGEPVDIVLKSDNESILDTIAEKHCILGYNAEQEDDPYLPEDAPKAYVALYGRLQEFVVLPFYKENPELETLTIDW